MQASLDRAAVIRAIAEKVARGDRIGAIVDANVHGLSREQRIRAGLTPGISKSDVRRRMVFLGRESLVRT